MQPVTGGINDSSRFIIPFHLKDGKKNKCEKRIFNPAMWEQPVLCSQYLVGFVSEIFENTEATICRSYRLKDAARAAYGLPEAGEEVFLVSQIMSGETETYSFAIKEVSAFCFATGIGFLILNVEHDKENSFTDIVNKCFAISNIFMEEQDNSAIDSSLRFYCIRHEKKQDISLKKSVDLLLQTAEHQEQVQIFPSNRRKRMNGYHRIYLENRTDADDDLMLFLSKGLHSNSLSALGEDVFGGSGVVNATQNTSCRVCSNGVVFRSYADDQNEEYLKNIYPRNIDRDYFLLYILALHERENLLRYNYLIVKDWDNSRKLTRIREDLLQYSVWSEHSVVSTETSYQSFYTGVCEALCIEKMEKGVSDIVSGLNDAVIGKKERKTGAILSAIAVLAVFSALADSMAFIDRIWYSCDRLEWGHGLAIAVVLLVIVIGVIRFWRKR